MPVNSGLSTDSKAWGASVIMSGKRSKSEMAIKKPAERAHTTPICFGIF